EDEVLALEAERFEVRPPDRRRGVDVEDARDADLHPPPTLERRLGRSDEGPPHRRPLHAAKDRPLHLNVLDQRARLRERLRRVDAAEEHLALAVAEAQVLEPPVLAP